jgi:hypothetical protein
LIQRGFITKTSRASSKSCSKFQLPKETLEKKEKDGEEEEAKEGEIKVHKSFFFLCVIILPKKNNTIICA